MTADMLPTPRDLTEDHFDTEHDVYSWLFHFFGPLETDQAYDRIDAWLAERGLSPAIEEDAHGTETDESYQSRLHADRHRSPTMSLSIWREAVLQIQPELADCIVCGKPDGRAEYDGLCWRCELGRIAEKQ